MRLWVTVVIVVAASIFVRIRDHPCGFVGGIVEQGNFHEHFWDSLPPSLQWCLIDTGVERARPTHFISHFNTFWTILFEVQSRYIETWPVAPSYNLELELATFLDMERAQFTANGDGALTSALQALGIGYKDEVVVPTRARVGVASSVSMNGGFPIMADIDESLGLNPRTLSSYITPRTKGIIAVHPCNITAIKEVAERNKLFLIEEISEVFGSTIDGKLAGTFGTMGVSHVGETSRLQSGGAAGLIWSNDTKLIERMGWAIENGLGAWGSVENLPSYKRSFGGEQKPKPVGPDGLLEFEKSPPFAGNCFRSPSEWAAEFVRNEFLFNGQINAKLINLKNAFSATIKPQYQALLQWDADASGVGLDAVALILKKEAHVKLLQEYLNKNKVILSDSDSWQEQYLPNVPSLMKKISFHSSGYPWVTDEEKKPLKYEDYVASHSILKRTLRILLSIHYTESMMRAVGVKVNQGLDQIMQA